MFQRTILHHLDKFKNYAWAMVYQNYLIQIETERYLLNLHQ